jgi:uncharacterized membrane protein YkvA (DUF1232 family)
MASARKGLTAAWRERARSLRADAFALYLAARDPRVPLGAKLVAAVVVAYALSPIDLIPDFVPVLGYLDDLLLVPLGVALAVRLVPPPLLAEHRAEAARRFAAGGPSSRAGAIVVVAHWLLLAAWLASVLMGCARAPSYTERYAASHPGWSAEGFPVARDDLAGALAALRAPRSGARRGFVQKLRVFDISDAEWREIAEEDVAAGREVPRAERSYLIVTLAACAESAGALSYANYGSAVSWYVLLGNEMEAYQHFAFDRVCGEEKLLHAPQRSSVDYWVCIDRYARGLFRQVEGAESCGAAPDPRGFAAPVPRR